MSTQLTRQQLEQDTILVIIVLISILITEFIDALQCLTLRTSKFVTQEQAPFVTQSKTTTRTRSGKVTTQRLSPCTKPLSTTVDQRKEDGGTKVVTHNSPIASSPRSKQSKPSSTTSKNTKSRSSQASGSRRRTTTTKSTSPMTTLRSTPKPNHTTADDNSRRLQPNHGNILERQGIYNANNTGSTTDWIEHQPTEPLHVLP